MSNTLHLTKADFRVDWFSGRGAGGQHRNKHQNCCRITHVESGISATGQASRSRVENQRHAFEELAKVLIDRYTPETQSPRGAAGTTVVQSYREPDNLVVDHGSGETSTYSEVVIRAKPDGLIDAARQVPKKDGKGQQSGRI